MYINPQGQSGGPISIQAMAYGLYHLSPDSSDWMTVALIYARYVSNLMHVCLSRLMLKCSTRFCKSRSRSSLSSRMTWPYSVGSYVGGASLLICRTAGLAHRRRLSRGEWSNFKLSWAYSAVHGRSCDMPYSW